jgi:pilus assembly protein CpaE
MVAQWLDDGRQATLMLNTVIVCPNHALLGQLKDTLVGTMNLTVSRTYSHYPSVLEITQCVRANQPDLLFVGMDVVESALQVVAAVQAEFPALPLIAIDHGSDRNSFIAMMRAGVRDCISPPFNRDSLKATLALVDSILQRARPDYGLSDRVYSFLPAKAGVGCTTVALNTSFAIAQISRQPTLLVDCDLTGGIMRFLLKLTNHFSLQDAAQAAHELDEDLWSRLITRFGSLDVLHSGLIDLSFRIETTQGTQMVEFWRRIYKTICLDFSGGLESFSVDRLCESKLVFLVSTPELTSLYLAKEKIRSIEHLQLGDRLRLVMNRTESKSPISNDEISKLVGLPIFMSFCNDYQAVNNAIHAGTHIQRDSRLVAEFQNFARSITVEPQAEARAKRGDLTQTLGRLLGRRPSVKHA